MILFFIEDLEALFLKLLILLDGGIYFLVGFAYKIFNILATGQLLENDVYASLVNNIYIILSVVILFVIAYNVLNFIIDPDKNTNGKEVENMLKKIVTSFILIVLCPLLFETAFKFQATIIKQNTIGNIFKIAGNANVSTDKVIEYYGNGQIDENSAEIKGAKLAVDAWESFFYKVDGSGAYTTTGYDYIMEGMDDSDPNKFESHDGCYSADVEKTGFAPVDYWIDVLTQKPCTLGQAKFLVFRNLNFTHYTAFSRDIVDKKVSFSFFLSLAAGIYLLYVLVSFCFDMAIRIAKLVFYQLLAPICISTRILPNNKIFSNWWNATRKTFLSVFVRIFIMELGMFLINTMTQNMSNFCSGSDCKGATSVFVKIFLILGVITFIKQSSKLIDEIFGFGDVKLGIRDKFKEGFSPLKAIGTTAIGAGMGAAGFIAGARRGGLAGGIRAARTNYKNRNLSGIEAETQRRIDYETALANGATKAQLRRDAARKAFGLSSTQTEEDRRIGDMTNIRDFTVSDSAANLKYKQIQVQETDEKGNLVTKDVLAVVGGKNGENIILNLGDVNSAQNKQYQTMIGNDVQYNTALKNDLDTRKEEYDRNSKNIDDRIRRIQDINSKNQASNEHGNKMESRAESKLREAKGIAGEIKRDFTIEGKALDAQGNTIRRMLNVSGGLQAMEAQVGELLKDSSLDGDTRTKIQTEFSKAKESMLFEFMDRSGDSVVESEYTQLVDDIKAGGLKDLEGNIINTFEKTIIDSEGNEVKTMVSVDELSKSELRDQIKKVTGGINSDSSTKINNLSREKSANDQFIKDIDELNRLHEQTQAKEKRSDAYIASAASTKYTNDYSNKGGKK